MVDCVDSSKWGRGEGAEQNRVWGGEKACDVAFQEMSGVR